MDRKTLELAMARATASTCQCGKRSVQSGIIHHLTPQEAGAFRAYDSAFIRFCSADCFRKRLASDLAQPQQPEAKPTPAQDIPS